MIKAGDLKVVPALVMIVALIAAGILVFLLAPSPPSPVDMPRAPSEATVRKLCQAAIRGNKNTNIEKCAEKFEVRRQRQLEEARTLRANQIAEEGIYFAYKQTWIADAGVGLSVITVMAAILAAFFAKQAADEARTAARAAVDSTRLALASQRSYLAVSSVAHNGNAWMREEAAFEWRCRIKNLGSVPAIIRSAKVGAEVTTAPQFVSLNDDVSVSGVTLMSGETFELLIESSGADPFRKRMPTKHFAALPDHEVLGNLLGAYEALRVPDMGQTFAGAPRFWLTGHLEYEDVVGARHALSFGFTTTAHIDMPAHQAGGGEINWRT